MTDFSNFVIRKARVDHICCECKGLIHKGEQYEKAFIVYEGSSAEYKTCMSCKETLRWLLEETDWPDDIDGEWHTYFLTMLSEHLNEQYQNGDYAFREKCLQYSAEMRQRFSDRLLQQKKDA